MSITIPRRVFLLRSLMMGPLLSAGWLGRGNECLARAPGAPHLLSAARAAFGAFTFAPHDSFVRLEAFLEPFAGTQGWLYACPAGLIVAARREVCDPPSANSLQAVRSSGFTSRQLAQCIGLTATGVQMELANARTRLINHLAGWKLAVATTSIPERRQETVKVLSGALSERPFAWSSLI